MLPSGILTCCTGPFWSDSLCLFGFRLLSLRCLISALTLAGRGGLLLRFASSVPSCCGEGGALQAEVSVCGELSPCSGRAARGLALPPTALRAFWPDPTLWNAAGSSPFRPLLLVAGAGVWGTFLLGVAFRKHVICGPYFNFSSQLSCPPRSENFPQTRQREGFLVIGNFLYWDSFPGTGLPPSFWVSLF